MLTSPSFEWTVCVDGYEWVPPREDDLDTTIVEPAGSTRSPIDWNLRARSKREKRYAPFRDDPELFIRASKLAMSLTRDGVLGFASKYGQIVQPSANTDNVALRHWRRLKDLIPVFEQWVNNKRLTDEHVARVNMALAGKRGNSEIVAQIEPPYRRADMPAIVLTPTTLLGVAWAQLATAICDGAYYRPCEAPGCHRGFVIRPGYERSTRRYCDGACKKRAQRAAASLKAR